MPVLVTGATGLVGRALVPRLVASGGQVRVYVRRDVPEYRTLGVKVAIGDADHEGRLESALEQVHTLVHLVGGPSPERGVTVEWLNVETTEVALRAATNAGVRRVLFLSHAGAQPGVEHPYLAAKAAAENAVSASGLEHGIFRCGPILGPGCALLGLLRRGRAPRSEDVRLNPVAVGDVVDALAAADTRDEPLKGTWDLGGPEILTLEELEARAGIAANPMWRLLGRGKEVAALYAQSLIADPTEAIRQFRLVLTPLGEAIAAAR